MSQNPEKHSPYFNLKDAFREKHCPICYLARKAVSRYLDNLLYEGVNNPGLRKVLRGSHGFCEKHFWQLVTFGDGLGISILSKDLLETIHQHWGEDPKSLIKEEKPKEECPACNIWNQNERNYSTLFVEQIDDFFLTFEFKHSFGFCLDHFRIIYRSVQDSKTREALLVYERGKIENISKELGEFIRKHDYQFSKEGYGKEADSWIRAVELLKGRTDLMKVKDF